MKSCRSHGRSPAEALPCRRQGLHHARPGVERGVAEDRLDNRADLEIGTVELLERAARCPVERGGDKIAPELLDEERGMVWMAQAEAHGVLPVEGAALVEDALRPGVVPLALEMEVVRAETTTPLVVEAGQRPRLLPHILLAVAAAGAEREELHQLAGVVLVRRPLRVLRPGEPEQHRRIARDLVQHRPERAERASAQQLVLVQHQLLRADAGE